MNYLHIFNVILVTLRRDNFVHSQPYLRNLAHFRLFSIDVSSWDNSGDYEISLVISFNFGRSSGIRLGPVEASDREMSLKEFHDTSICYNVRRSLCLSVGRSVSNEFQQ
jgi:hypothetical protein